MALINKQVKDIMTEKVKTADEQTPVQEVAEMMAHYNIGAVVVLSAIQEPIGIFTERDLLKRVVAHKEDLSTPVSKVMTPKFICVQAEDELGDIPILMVNGNFRHLPVVDGRKLIGILSVRDVLRHLG